jgi:hypothetical protein
MFHAMVEGYTIVEKLYLRRPSDATAELTDAILRLYTAVLNYLGKAKSYYQKSTISML